MQFIHNNLYMFNLETFETKQVALPHNTFEFDRAAAALVTSHQKQICHANHVHKSKSSLIHFVCFLRFL